MQRNNVALAVIFSLNIPAIQAESFMMDADEDLMLLYEDEEIIEIATGTAKPIHLAPSVASVITARDIKASGARSLSEALELVPGLHVAPSYVVRLNTTYAIRGIQTGDNAQVLLTINGMSVKNLTNGARLNFFEYPVSNIARIEIIRGPGSAVHGSDAYAGVINVITKNADQIGDGEAGLRAGSYQTNNTWVQGAETIGSWKMSAAVDYFHTNGDDARTITTDGIGRSGTLDTQKEILNTQLGFVSDDWHIRLWSWNLRDAGFGPGAVNILSPESTEDIAFFQFDVMHHLIQTDSWILDGRLTYQYTDDKSSVVLFPTGTSWPIGADGNLFTPNPGCVEPGGVCLATFADGVIGEPGYKGEMVQLEFSSIYSFDKHKLRFGAGVAYQKVEANESKNFGPGVLENLTNNMLVTSPPTSVTGTNNIYLPDQSSSNIFLSIQDEWQFANDWEFTGGVRYDDYSDTGDTINPRLAVVWATNYNWTTKFLYGSAFRAPAYTEEYFQNNPAFVGRKGIDPEKIHTFEIVFDVRPSLDVHNVFNIFYYKAKDLIGLAPSIEGMKFENLTDQKGYGFEFETQWDISNKLMLAANFAWQHSENTDTKKAIPFVPGRQFSTYILYKPQIDTSLYLSYNRVMNRARETNVFFATGFVDDPRATIDDYGVVNVTVRKEISNQLEFSVAFKNLLDEDVYEPSAYSPFTVLEDFPMEGRTFFAEAIYSF